MAKDERDPDWIEDGEKYALIGVCMHRDRDLGRLDVVGGLTVLPDAAFELSEFWREWLGTVRVENVQELQSLSAGKNALEAAGCSR